MKKVILCAALLIGCVAFVNAQAARISADNAVTQLASDDYKEVKLADLSQVVQDAVKEIAGETYDVKKVEFNAEKELTKVTLVGKEDGSAEKTVVLDKEGKEVKE